MKGPKMDTYKNLMVFVNGDDAGALMRSLMTVRAQRTANPAICTSISALQMPRRPNLETFKKWVGSWNLKRSLILPRMRQRRLRL